MVDPERITVKTLPSGWVHLRWGGEGFAQFPPDFSGDRLPDEYVFQPDWNRDAAAEALALAREGMKP